VGYLDYLGEMVEYQVSMCSQPSLLQKDADGVGESRRCKSRWNTQLAQLMDKVYKELREITLSKA
jgi:hypothetical protein